ncbi:hypothetical protein HDF16_003234 [Granulicella aggregans]|uniref:Peptidase n=1 Tax=Granulicella aggregans TaxID=474949 RepID=A0A7W8E5T6_9BACT|nr:zinc-dependent metalloprotease [Granulicella aggregans]MBB5058520.1 hypothetical protein [Granulicella aggregans]
MPRLSLSPLLCRMFLPSAALALLPCALSAQGVATPNAQPSIAAKTASMRHLTGLLPLDWDAATGRLYLEIPKLSQDLLYTDSLPYGTGSNDLGLDRGQIGPGRIVRFERSGPKVLLVQANEAFRSSAADPAEVLAVKQSFPESVLFGFTVAAEDANGEVLVDATDFFVRDAHGVVETLQSLEQGTYKVDPTRSAIALDATKAFPKNTEVEAILTFTTEGAAKGEFVKNVTPDAHAMTVREHQSFIELPPAGFVPRKFDPRAGYFPSSYRDYSVALGESLDQKFILRHRLVKKDPACVKDCEPVAPIQYYVDRGAPEPIRTALLEGARWWNQAFTAAGWKDAFKVDILPADADPMDVRYNIIQWVHRYTRGWSYGEAVADPRTGEIIKGNVTLGSLRGRQDYMIAEALLSPYPDGKALPAKNDPMLAMVLARIRQLSAHETGHTLGLAHNFAASSFSQSASVMDYPHPYVTLDAAGIPDVSHAYAVNIGAWDKVAIDYGYRDLPANADQPTLSKPIDAALKRGMYFITDEDARPLGGAHPHAHLWDNGADATDELNRVLDARAVALKRFGEGAIRSGEPMAELEDKLVLVYLLHRYQTEAAAKVIGGLDYRYALRGDGQTVTEIVKPEEQRKALAAVLKTLSPETLELPESLLKILPPMPAGMERTRESFASHTGLTFDPIAAAESSADLTLGLLFHPQRASRLEVDHARDGGAPSLNEVIDQTLAATRPDAEAGTMKALIADAVFLRTVEALLRLAANPAASSVVRATTIARLDDLKQKADVKIPVYAYAVRRIEEFDRNPEKFAPVKAIEAPPGMPIGDDDETLVGFQAKR